MGPQSTLKANVTCVHKTHKATADWETVLEGLTETHWGYTTEAADWNTLSFYERYLCANLEASMWGSSI